MANDQSVNIPRILIIENEFLIGEMLKDMVQELGYTVTGTVHRVPTALAELIKANFDAALVNIGVDQQKHGIELADLLKANDKPFAFVTGYPHSPADRHEDALLLEKPFDLDQLRELLEKLVGPAGSPKGAFHAGVNAVG